MTQRRRQCGPRSADTTGARRSGHSSNKTAPPAIEKLPFLGTTWHARGPAYWFRRVLASLLMLLGLGAATAITAGLVGAIVQSHISVVVKIIAVLIIAAAIGVSMARAFKAFFRTEQNRKNGDILRPEFDEQRARSQGHRYAAAGTLLAAATRTGSFITGALLVVSVVCCFGWFIVLFVWTLQKELGVEHDARIRLERRNG